MPKQVRHDVIYKIRNKLLLHHLAMRAAYFNYFAFKVLFLEYEYGDDAYGYGRIGEIEYRAEKYKILATPYWEPIREITREQREIEHIHHAAIKQVTVLVQDAVKCGVDNIAERASKYKSHTGDQSAMVFVVDEIYQYIANTKTAQMRNSVNTSLPKLPPSSIPKAIPLFSV